MAALIRNLQKVVAKMSTDAIASGSPNNNPRVPSAAEVLSLYQQIWMEGELSHAKNAA
jgi:hypothetical protein